MEITYSFFDLLFYFLLYSFTGWAAEVCCVALMKRRFINRGFLNLPLELPYGVTAVILLLILPTMGNNLILQFIMTWVVFCMVWILSEQFVKGVSRKNADMTYRTHLFPLRTSILVTVVVAAAYMVLYLIVHPVIFAVVTLMPHWLTMLLTIVIAVLVAADFISVLYALRTNTSSTRNEATKAETKRLENRITDFVWKRLQKAYPGIREAGEASRESYSFAKGFCFDKLVWVFLISSFLGALIEMVYCRVMGDIWMNRSSLLYGSFSVVWGFGAVVLTVTLQHLAGKPDRAVFMAGFVIGGVYEYFCSVCTEIVFGTVFWDYSEMPLNIGGRTNVLYCIFWGILSVVWIRMIYPVMDRWIEKLPVLPGKIVTWVLVVILACDAVLTSAAMIRYTDRRENPQPENVIEQFLDSRYDDQWMEHRWPNMFLPDAE